MPMKTDHALITISIIVLSSANNLYAKYAVRYLARLADGTLYEKKGYEGEQPFIFIIDEGTLHINYLVSWNCLFLLPKFIYIHLKESCYL